MAEREPLLAPEARQILGVPAYHDEERNNALELGNLAFTAESMGLRGLMYTRILRMVAQQHRAERPDLSGPEWLTPQTIGNIALANAEELSHMARSLAVVNTAEQALAEQEASFLGGLRPRQHPYLHDIVSFLGAAPSVITVADEQGNQRRTSIRGATVEAPTGAGKTVLIARTLVALGVGRNIEHLQGSHGRVRALLIVPSQDLVEQSAGLSGDDTLRRFAPGIDVGAYYQHQKNPHADVVVITIEQFIKEFKNNQLHGQSFDVCIIDEAHHATEPLFERALLQHWHGGPIIGFTATPRYFEGKDVRNLLPRRIFHGDILDYIQDENDILNAAQLFMVRVACDQYISEELLAEFAGQHLNATDIEQYAIREATADMLEPLLAQGRRGIVFCEQGGGQHYAQLMAERLAAITLPDGRPVRTAVAGNINAGKPTHLPDSNQSIRKRYRKGELDVITTVKWGTEGLNEDIDFVCVTCDVTSPLRMLQLIGRGTRLSARFPVTIYCHLFAPSRSRRAVSMYGALGLEEVEQGIVIGKRRGGSQAQTATKSSNNDIVPISLFPARLQELMAAIDHRTVSEAVLHPNLITPVPPAYKKLTDITQHVPGRLASIRRHLREEKGFASVSRFEQHREFVVYFEPAAQEYLQQFQGAVARVDLQRKLDNMDVSALDKLAADNGVSCVDWFYSDGKYIPHYVQADAAKLEAVFFATPYAEPTDYARSKLAATLGVHPNKLRTMLTAEEWAQAAPKRARVNNRQQLRILDHWSQADAEKILARIAKTIARGNRPPPQVVRLSLVSRRVPRNRKWIATRLKQLKLESKPHQIGKIGPPPKCIDWTALRYLEAECGVRPQAASIDIDYSRLPTGPTDTDPDRLAYADTILALLESIDTQDLPHY